MAFTVMVAHHPPLFIGSFLFFLAFAQATAHHQGRLELKSPLLVGFFLAGLVVFPVIFALGLHEYLTDYLDSMQELSAEMEAASRNAITARGFGGAFNLVTLNGRTLPAANVAPGFSDASSFGLTRNRSASASCTEV